MNFTALVAAVRHIRKFYGQLLRIVVFSLTFFAGFGILVMMSVTCLDVLLRIVGLSITGAYDIVSILGALVIASALPYTTAVKGHVAIEYFFHKLHRLGRIILDTFLRLLSITLFLVLAYQSVRYGNSLYRSGEVTPTLQIPTFWVLYVIAFSCAVVVLVIIHNLLHPGKEMIRP